MKDNLSASSARATSRFCTRAMDYNFGRVHLTLRVTPAMEAGVSDHVWSVEGIVGLLEA